MDIYLELWKEMDIAVKFLSFEHHETINQYMPYRFMKLHIQII